MAHDSSVELIEFIRPCGNANNLYIKNISKDLNEEEAQVRFYVLKHVYHDKNK